ncbi:MAG: tetratricopeptide repeat protein [Bacteroidetes bacterium]|nr:MAG: tetratricopeptide repeat protein [Bacteroidota bacterium]
MGKNVVVAVLAILLISGVSKGQTARIDSLLQVYAKQPGDTTKMATLTHLINAFMYRDPDRSMAFAREKLTLARNLEFKRWESLANYHIGVLKINQDQFDSAKTYFNQAYQLAMTINDTYRIVLAVDGMSGTNLKKGNFAVADSLNDINIAILKEKNDQYRLATVYIKKSQINKKQGNFNIAYNYALEALRLMKEFDKPVRMADILLQLAVIEQELGNISEAIVHSKEALQIYSAHSDLMYQAVLLGNLGELFTIQGNYNEALDLLKESVAKADSAGTLTIKAAALNRLGNLYILQNRYPQAQKELDDALEIASRIGDLSGKVKILNTLGLLFNQTNNPQQALQNLNESIRISEQLNLRPDKSKAYLERSLSHESMGMNPLALSDFKTHKRLSDSIFASEKIQQIDELRIIYETEKKDQEIEIQKFQIELLAQKERNNRNRILLLTILLVSSVVTVFMVQVALRQKLKRRKLEHEITNNMLALKKREITAQILHIAQKNDLLQELKEMIQELKSECPNSNLQKRIINKINIDINSERSWEHFQTYFEDLHKGFDEKIRSIAPEISQGEMRLIVLLKMNLSSPEVASVLNISQEGIKKARYRLRKKLGLETTESLEEFLNTIRVS